MTYRAHYTAAEARRIMYLDRAIAEHNARLKPLYAEKRLLSNRARQRAWRKGQ